MKDLETKITRSHEIRDEELVVIRRQEGKNGSDRFVSVITEETGITKKEVDEVLETAVPREIEKVDKEMAGYVKDLDEVSVDVDKFKDDPEYLHFKEYINGEKIKGYFENVKKEDLKVKLDKQIEFCNDKKDDLLDWKKQFEDINETLNK